MLRFLLNVERCDPQITFGCKGLKLGLCEPAVWLAGLATGVACALVGGWLGLRNLLRQPPLQTLRETG